MSALKRKVPLLIAAASTTLIFGVSHNVGAQGVLEEIVVTARRVEESITDAPLAVAVMDSGFLADQGVENMQDVLELTPGADWNMFAKAQPAFTIRGINAGAFGNSTDLECGFRVGTDTAGESESEFHCASPPNRRSKPKSSWNRS